MVYTAERMSASSVATNTHLQDFIFLPFRLRGSEVTIRSAHAKLYTPKSDTSVQSSSLRELSSPKQ